jgi:hypothetical protein
MGKVMGICDICPTNMILKDFSENGRCPRIAIKHGGTNTEQP